MPSVQYSPNLPAVLEYLSATWLSRKSRTQIHTIHYYAIALPTIITPAPPTPANLIREVPTPSNIFPGKVNLGKHCSLCPPFQASNPGPSPRFSQCRRLCPVMPLCPSRNKCIPALWGVRYLYSSMRSLLFFPRIALGQIPVPGLPVPHPGKRATKGEHSRVFQPSQYQIPHPTCH